MQNFSKTHKRKRFDLDKKKPIRMCIVCRERFLQNTLLRFQIKESKIVKFSAFGRSAYICQNCVKKDEKTLKKAFSRHNKGEITPNLEEICPLN